MGFHPTKLGFLGLAVLELCRGTRQTDRRQTDGRTDRQRSLYNAPIGRSITSCVYDHGDIYWTVSHEPHCIDNSGINLNGDLDLWALTLWPLNCCTLLPVEWATFLPISVFWDVSFSTYGQHMSDAPRNLWQMCHGEVGIGDRGRNQVRKCFERMI